GRAYFDVLSSAVQHGNERLPCPAVAAIRAAAPGDIGGAKAPLALQACGGEVRVTPIRPEAAPVPAPAPANPAAPLETTAETA
ncbi:MAG TPA: hypothetical protein VGB49_03080, partial [Caulobacteraceae bacterium]